MDHNYFDYDCYAKFLLSIYLNDPSRQVQNLFMSPSCHNNRIS